MKTNFSLLCFFFVCHIITCFSPTIPNNVGVNVHFTTPRAGEMDIMKNASVKYARMDIIWAEIEKQKGRYDFSQWDIFISTMLNAGITPYLIFDYNCNFYDQGLSPYTDEGRNAFANFALASVQRYNGKGIIWEVYNEPNGGFWKPSPNVDNYCKLANTVVSVIKEHFPNEFIVGPATSGIDLKYLEGVFKCGLLKKFDAISVHPYGSHTPEDATKKYDELKDLMKLYGGEKTIFSGEWGYHDVKIGVDEQGQYVSRMFAVNALNHIPLSIWYDFHDDGLNKTWGEDHFGLSYYNYFPGRSPCFDLKPSFFAVKAYQTLLNGYHFSKKHDTVYVWHHISEYQNDSGISAFAVWSSMNVKGHIDVHVGKDKKCDIWDHLGFYKGEKTADSKGVIKAPEENGVVYLIPK